MKAEDVKTMADLHQWIHDTESPECRDKCSSWFNGYVAGAEEKCYSEGIKEISYRTKVSAEPMEVNGPTGPVQAYAFMLFVTLDEKQVHMPFVAIVNEQGKIVKVDMAAVT